MNKQETLDILQSVYKKIESMSEQELFEYMLNHSKEFNNDMVFFQENAIVSNNDVERIVDVTSS